MDDRQYEELLDAILGLREATEAGFAGAYRCFDVVGQRFNEQDEKWDRRFGALERRVEEGFRYVSASLSDITSRLSAAEQR